MFLTGKPGTGNETTPPQTTPSPVSDVVSDTAPTELFPPKKPAPIHENCDQPPQKKVVQWELKITVVCEGNTVPTDPVSWSLVTTEGAKEDMSKEVTLQTLEQLVFTHSSEGKKKFKASASLPHWDLVEDQSKTEATLEDGGKDQIKLVLRPRSWVKFKFLCNDKPVPKLTLDLSLADDSKPAAVTKDLEILPIDDIKVRGACKIAKVTHPDKCYVFFSRA